MRLFAVHSAAIVLIHGTTYCRCKAQTWPLLCNIGHPGEINGLLCTRNTQSNKVLEK